MIRIRDFPPQVQELKKHLYYVATYGNLYAMTKSDHQIQQRYYKRGLRDFQPRLQGMNIIVIQG